MLLVSITVSLQWMMFSTILLVIVNTVLIHSSLQILVYARDWHEMLKAHDKSETFTCRDRDVGLLSQDVQISRRL